MAKKKKRRAVVKKTSGPIMSRRDRKGLEDFTEKHFSRELQDEFSSFLKGEAKLKGRKGGRKADEDEVPVINLKELTRIDNPNVSGMAFGKDYGIYNPSEITIDTFKKMKKDPQIAAALAFVKLPIMSLPWRIQCENDKIAKTVEYIIKPIWRSTLKSVLTAVEYGFASHEKVYALRDIHVRSENKTGKKKTFFKGPALTYKKIKPHYPDSITINVNKFDDFSSITQSMMGKGDVTIDKNKSFLFTNDYEFGNLYGMSRLESVYKYWYWKEIMYQFMLMYFERRGSPPVVATAPMGRSTDSDGTTRRDNLDVALDLASSLLSNSVAALPYQSNRNTNENMWGLEYLLDDKRGEMFIEAINHIDKAILHGIFLPDNTVTEGGSYSSSSVHADLFLMSEKGLVTDIELAVNTQLVPILVQGNFKRSEWCDCYFEMENLDFNRKLALKEIFIEMLRNVDNMVQIGLRPKIYPDIEELAKVLQIPVSTLKDEVDETEAPSQLPGEKAPTNVIPIDGAKSRAVPRRPKRESSTGTRDVDRKDLRPGGKRAEQRRAKMSEAEKRLSEPDADMIDLLTEMYGPQPDEDGAIPSSEKLRFKLIMQALTDDGLKEIKKGLMRYRAISSMDIIPNFEFMDNMDVIRHIVPLPDFAIDLLQEAMIRKLSDVGE